MGSRNIEAILPLTPLQQGILYHTLEAKKPGVYVGRFSCDLDGPLDGDRYRQAWRAVVARHAALRTLFTWDQREQPLQIVRERVDLPFEFEDWRALSPSQLENRWSERCAQLVADAFDLSTAPLVRLLLLRLGEDRHRFLFGFHHIALDGWSTRLLFDESLQHYSTLSAGEACDESPAHSFASYLEWLKKADTSTGIELFREMLSGFATPTIPRFRNEHESPANGTEMVRTRIGRDASNALTEAARQSRLTLNTLVVAAWAEVLQRYCDTDDVVFGTTLAGRPPTLDGVERIAGLFINTLPLRIRGRSEQSLLEWLRDIQSLQGKVQDHQQAPLIDVLRQSNVGRGTPLFESIVVFENLPATTTTYRRSPAVIDPEYVEFSNFPLAILVVPSEELELIAVIDQQMFSTADAKQLLAHLEALLLGLGKALTDGKEDLPMLSPADRQRLVHDLNDTSADLGEILPVHRYIETIALDEPERTALVDADERFSFAEMDRQANRLAHLLTERGVGRGTFVPLVMARSTRAVIAMLAVLKAGAAYSAIDDRLPPKRIASQIADLRAANDEASGPTVTICDRQLAEEIAGTVVRIDVCWDSISERSGAASNAAVSPEDPAYVMFTSGSSGKPKGVVVNHANLVNSTLARSQFYREPLCAFLMLSSLSTDSSVAGTYWSLLSGATLVLPRGRQEQDVGELAELIVRHGISHLLAVPSLYDVMLEHCDAAAFSAMTAVIVAGESCPQSLVEKHHAKCPDVGLFNEYGPTEATVWATCAELRPGTPVSIGKPVANARVYVVDSRRRLVPEGIAGELYIGGLGVARGYLNDAALTQKKFIADPFTGDSDTRLYRTGDRVAWRREGQLEFLGRVDNQVKVRGYRVEPEEIEAVIARLPAVAAAIVFVDDSRRLTACVEPAAVSLDELRRHAQLNLPEYMVPQRFAMFDELPRNRAGKIDRTAVRAAEWSEASETEDSAAFVAPRDETERILAEAWSKILGMDELSIHDNFFEVGGDSLLSIRILAQLGSAGLRISPDDFFAHPTIAEQAGIASLSGQARDTSPEEIGPVPLSPIQHWFAEHVNAADEPWNQSWLYKLSRPISLASLRRAVTALIAQHDALRLSFENNGGQLTQHLGDADENGAVFEVRIEASSPSELRERIDEVATATNRQIALGSAPLMRFVLFRIGGESFDRLLVCCHHVIMDALSFHFIEEDIESALAAIADGNAISLPPRSTPVSAWCRRLARDGRELVSDADRAYWERAAANAVCRLPCDSSAGANDEAAAETVFTHLDANHTKALLERVSNSYRASIREVLLAALCRSLSSWNGSPIVTVDIEAHGREHLFDDIDISRTVGWLTSVFPVNLRNPGDAGLDSLLTATKETMRGLPLNGLGHGLLKYLAGQTDKGWLRSAPPAQICFNYFPGTSAQPRSQRLLEFEREHCGRSRGDTVRRAYLIEVNIAADDSRLDIEWRYSRNRHRKSTIERLAREYMDSLAQLVDFCISGETDGTSPADFPMAGLDSEGLAEIAGLLDGDDDGSAL